MLDILLLSRIQFALTISFHILFPAVNIGLVWILLYFKLNHTKTGDILWLEAYQFWVKIFALSFALGVVSGIVMSFQFGTNWPGFMEHFGNIAGPLLAYEVLTAFFLEATFLGIMLFGYNRVSNFVHNISILLVAIGTSLSAFWIIALNSWMHTPTGFSMVEGVAYADDWFSIIFNPSMMYRLVHMYLASLLTASFFIAGVSSYQILRGKNSESIKLTLKTGIKIAMITSLLQLVSGDMLGINTLRHQPAKIAAIEGIWEGGNGMPLLLFALPNQQAKRNDYALGIPKLASLILTHNKDGALPGLNQFTNQHPPVTPVFWCFRIMVGIGILMLLSSIISYVLININNKINTLILKILYTMSFAGWVGLLSGWYVTEIGRQPYLIYGVFKTKDAIAKQVPTYNAIMSLILYAITYLFIITAYIHTVFYLARKADKVVAINPVDTVPSKSSSTL